MKTIPLEIIAALLFWTISVLLGSAIYYIITNPLF